MEKEKGVQKAGVRIAYTETHSATVSILTSSELTGESGRAVSARETDADTSFSSDDGRGERVEGEKEGEGRGKEREMERRSENGRRRGWLRECTKLFLSRGNRGVLCALRHRQAALCSVHAMRIDWPGPYESGYTTSGRRFRLLSSSSPSPASLFRLALRVFYRTLGWEKNLPRSWRNSWAGREKMSSRKRNTSSQYPRKEKDPSRISFPFPLFRESSSSSNYNPKGFR